VAPRTEWGQSGQQDVATLIILPECDPRLCRGLAFLRSHAVMLQARQLLPNA
jgi:hypothetical protein